MNNPSRPSEAPRVQRWAAVLWPSFLVACAATVLFFAAFDPLDLLACAGRVPAARLAGYTVGFFGFWILGAVSSLLTCYFLRPVAELNRRD
jgi:hypothetical protein